MSQCQCPLAGYCDPHKRTMTDRQHAQCRDEPGMFAAFAARAAKPSPCAGKRPSFVDKARHLAIDAAKLGGAIVTGQRVLATREEIAARKAACSGCPKNEDGWCGLCGCNLAAKQKSVAWDCPIGRWPSLAEPASLGSS